MADIVSSVLTRLEKKFPDGPLDDAGVRAQTFRFLPGSWRNRWPESLELPKTLRTEERHVNVSRQDVFDRARSVQTEGDAIDLYVLMGAWGTGTKARPLARVAKPLEETDVGARLLRSYAFVREGNPGDAYRRLQPRGEDYIKNFGPSFFTKWLYFSAHDVWSSERGPEPLILDGRVASVLGWKSSGWSAGQYLEYLKIVERIRRKWARDSALHCIEHALFTLGGDST